ncbi:MAG TPA: glycerate kinase, partial [Solirubrobacterales bacterium]
MGRPDPPPSEARANGGDGAAGPVLVAPDSFKGTFSAIEVAAALASGLAAVGLGTDCCPVADGGEGTMEAILATIGGETVSA